MPARPPRATRALTLAAVCGALAALAVGPRPAAAQAWFTPSFQPPQVSDRDYTAGVVANSGTSALFQWREGLGPTSHFSLEAGLADPKGYSGTKLLLGGQYAYRLAAATAEQPLDLLLTAGLGVTAGSGPDLLRIPVGLSVGHRFPLEGGMAITPYAHPRISLDSWTERRAGIDRTKLSIDFDLGASFEITRQVALRGSLVLTGAQGADDVGLGIGLTITPAGLRR